jgi:alkylation response protein AidB-like acyl-CoA dehydrogenase
VLHSCAAEFADLEPISVQFTFTEEQEQFRDMVRRFAADQSPTSSVRRLMETADGFEPSLWTQISSQLGLTALRIPEQYGGSGFTAVELGIVMEEFGRALVCAPYFSSAVLATELILAAGTESDHAVLLPALADGSQRATFALVEASGSWDPADVATRAQEADGVWHINGVKRFVIDGHTADYLLVAARTDDGLALFTVAGNADGLARIPVTGMDATRKMADVIFTDTVATRFGNHSDATAAIARAMDAAAVALANEMVGGAQALLDSAVAYAKMRVQFGRTIGSFQAIKHKCADMLLDVESAKSAAYAAASAAAETDPEAPALANLAKALASEAYIRTAAETIQIHGGIGFTWENDTHLWFKRAKSSEVMLGDPSWHRERLMQRWGY